MHVFIILVCLIGAVAGLIGFIPQFVLYRKALRGSKFMRDNAVAFGLLGVVVSMVVYIAFMLICAWLLPELLLYFAIAMVVVFLTLAIVFVMVNQKR